jgi:hypothetical protein
MSRPTSTSRVIGLIALLAGSALTSCADIHEPADDSLGATKTRRGSDVPAADGDMPTDAAGSSLAEPSVRDGADENGAAENPEPASDTPSAAAGSDAASSASGAGASAAAGSGASTAQQPPSAGAPVAIDSAQPTYEVPVAAELAEYAHYQVDGVQWREKNGERRLAYDLPADLIGHAQRVEFSGPASGTSTWSLQGQKFGDAECEQTGDQIACHETLNGIRVDLAAVEARVNAGELDPRQLDVTRIFESDPIGILRFTAP